MIFLMNIDVLVNSMIVDVYECLCSVVEIGKWLDGMLLSDD